MSLQAPNLDDRNFQDIVDETKLLIPKYCPEWTNHNLSDPGVALIELFAWMSEMLLYRLNQVPDRFYTKFLELMGVAPFPPTAAQADLTFWLSTVLPQPVTVKARTQVGAPALEGGPVIFETIEDLVIAPPQLIAAKTGRGGSSTEMLADAWDDLNFPGSALRCFTSEPAPLPGDALYLGFAASLAGAVVRFRVTTTTPAGIGIYPSRPPIVAEAWSGEAWVTVPAYSDTTGGLNRDGEVILLFPHAHEPLALGGTRAYWFRVVMTRTLPGEPSYQASPEISSVSVDALGGTTLAEHSVKYGAESLGRSNGLPGQSFSLRHAPLLPRREGEIVQVTTGNVVRNWQEVADFTGSLPTDEHYVLDGSTGTVYFGPRVRYPDGSWHQHGAVPFPNAEVTMLAYRHGGGSEGNLGAETLTSLRSTVAFIDRVTNIDPAQGGADAETVAEAKKRAPFSLRTRHRAVTRRDFERMATEASTEVARARCLGPASPGGPVRLLIVPKVRRQPESQRIDDFALTDGLVERIGNYLEPRRLLGASIEVSTPYYQGVTVACHLRALPTASDDTVTRARSDALHLLYEWVNPLTGGPNATGWPWDTDLNAGPIAQLLLDGVDGIERVDEVLLFECDLRTGRRHGPAREVVHLDDRSLFLSA
ncbi:MAG TPA: putative baseplate assembly protein, partial [Acidimicrobiales bacterium]|nr:putative baseplate assembly protein [Acidimicrobiales bacterium]